MIDRPLPHRQRRRRRLVAALTAVASLAGGAFVAAACTSAPDQPPLDTNTGGGSSGAVSGSSSGMAVDASGDARGSADAGVDGTVGDAGERDADATTESGLTQAFDARGFPDVNSVDVQSQCGVLTCSAGCCDLSGACQVGTSNTVCGGSGNPCQDCTLEDAQTCQSGVCQ
jgi:hypothetical protein